MHERITLEDSPTSAIVKLAEGNPGACRVLGDLFNQSPTIDPNAAFEGMAPVFALDMMGVYGSHIWLLYKDVCGSSILNMEVLFRAHQLGHVHKRDILGAISEESGERFDFPALLKWVQGELPNFSKQQEAKAA